MPENDHVDAFRLIVGLLVTALLSAPVMRLISRAGEPEEERVTGWRRPVGLAMGVLLLGGLLGVAKWATRPMLPGLFQYGGGEPYFIGSGGQTIGPGHVGCTNLSVIQQEGATPLISVGHLSWVTPLTRERGWVWSLPLGFEVFHAAHPLSNPPYPKRLWVKTGDDCYVEAHGYLG
jgi:hypothetical protein